MAAKTPKSPENDQIIEEMRSLASELEKESDRAAVVIGAAKLDLLLYQILQKFLRASTSNSDELLDGDSPLSTFSAKIHLCYRLKLIDAEFARALHLTRKIRNVFAHELATSTLDAGAHRDRVKELIAPLARYQIFHSSQRAFFGSQLSGQALNFRTAVAFQILRLERVLRDCGRIEHKYGVSLLSANWKLQPRSEEDGDKETESPSSK